MDSWLRQIKAKTRERYSGNIYTDVQWDKDYIIEGVHSTALTLLIDSKACVQLKDIRYMETQVLIWYAWKFNQRYLITLLLNLVYLPMYLQITSS